MNPELAFAADAGIARELSRRQMEVLRLVAWGFSNEHVALELDLTVNTVKTHLARIARKLKAGSRSEAAAIYRRAALYPANLALAGETLIAVPFEQLAALTERERDVLERIALGAGNEVIAAELALSPHTVRRHTAKIFSKLGVHRRVSAAAVLHANGR
jgi:DNA-binding NarL/FixJ family response regulator